MFVSEGLVHGASCKLIWGRDKSTLTLSLLNDEMEATGPQNFGALAYALPHNEESVVTVLISSNDQMVVDTATQVSQMLATLTQRPAFVNTTIRNANMMMMKSIKEYVEDELKAH